MTTQLRCEAGTLYGIASDDATGTVEVKCKRRRCGYASGVIVLHTISLETGLVTQTRRFKNPTLERKDNGSAKL